MSNSLMATYSPLPISFTHGEGVWLWDEQGRKYLDALSGIAVCGLGHAHPKLSEALAAQASRLLHVSNIYHIPEQEALGQQLCALADMDKVFFCNSGAEANEASIKLARLYGHQRGYEIPKIIVMENSFHGRTLATLSATGNPKVQAGFEPLVEGFIRVPFKNLSAIKEVAESHADIAAVLLEPIQGEGGVNAADDEYLKNLRQLCDEHGWLMMLDEVQTGAGRTGKWFAFQHTDIQPDVMNLAKGLGNGIPIGACLARGEAAEIFAPGKHGSTFGGNPFASVAAKTVLDIIEDENLLGNAARQGEYLLNGFRENLGDLNGIVDIRGKGLMIGIELDRPCAELVKQALETEDILINVTAGKVVRLLPPLVLDHSQADEIISRVSRLILNFLNEN
ncbi:MAG TPA: aspartate aminotransferase family protein [Chromatiales bacterium]|nr:aspartate aminotransferase family protein [Thiotrichales bacterium]HIP67851.1 aspartate aminotransferase family protein [Chromatiales bacterium]